MYPGISDMTDWLAKIHDDVENAARAASPYLHRDTGPLFEEWEWIYETTDDAIDLDQSVRPDGYIDGGNISDTIYLGSANTDQYVHPVLPGVREIEAPVARWVEMFDPAAVMHRVNSERALLRAWQVADRQPLAYRAAIWQAVELIAAGWAHMPGWREEWRTGTTRAVV